MQIKKAVLMYGIFPEFFEDGKRPDEISECNPNNEKNWMGWTKKELEKQGFEVTCPTIPKVWQSTYCDWKKEFDKIDIDENTTLVGLSAGNGAITRYIIEEKKKIKKLILIAPARFHPDEKWDSFYDFEIDKNVKEQIKNGTTIFYDSKDWKTIVKSVEMYKEDLNAKVVELPGKGHFSFEIPTLPELLEEILKAYKQ